VDKKFSNRLSRDDLFGIHYSGAPMTLDRFVEELTLEQLSALQKYKELVFETSMSCINSFMGMATSKKLTPTYVFSATVIAIVETIFVLTKAVARENPSAAQILRMRVKERIHEW
jgi:hypothetical protein